MEVAIFCFGIFSAGWLLLEIIMNDFENAWLAIVLIIALLSGFFIHDYVYNTQYTKFYTQIFVLSGIILNGLTMFSSIFHPEYVNIVGYSSISFAAYILVFKLVF